MQNVQQQNHQHPLAWLGCQPKVNCEYEEKEGINPRILSATVSLSLSANVHRKHFSIYRRLLLIRLLYSVYLGSRTENWIEEEKIQQCQLWLRQRQHNNHPWQNEEYDTEAAAEIQRSSSTEHNSGVNSR